MYSVRAPELEPSVAWINTPRPISIRDLKGQVVILDFWTYCCVNCMHVIPVLREIERRHHADPLVVIGIHSGKFDAESDPARVRDAVRRYGIEHPVVVDRDMGIWERYAVRSWPTLVVVNPKGTIAAVAPGEPDPDLLDHFVSELLDEARRENMLAPAPFRIEAAFSEEARPLAYPGKVAVAPDGRLAISDSAHHRVLVTTHEGAVLHAIGTGERGLLDGPFERCAFDDPQGLAWKDEILWICDARNHCLRRADLVTGVVTTVAGTGRMGMGLHRGPAPGRSVELRSPWDVIVDGDMLYIAMAGSHQIWRFDARSGEATPFAGSGREALFDGPAPESAWAQPSGLALRERVLLVADSETSAVRAIDLQTHHVTTLVGAGLFDFGDRDGSTADARMQHPLGVAVAADGAVIVADTYNDRLRRIDPSGARVETFFRGEGTRALREPAGIARDPLGGFIVADTNHHRIVRIGDRGEWLGEVTITGAPIPRQGEIVAAPVRRSLAVSKAAWFTASLQPEEGRACGEGPMRLALTLEAPPGWKFALESNARLTLEVSRRSDLLVFDHEALVRAGMGTTHVDFEFTGEVARLPAPEIGSEVLITADAVLCSEGEGARCAPARGWFRLPLTLARDGDPALRFRLPLGSPDSR